jgi:predicted metal-dependent peptidase
MTDKSMLDQAQVAFIRARISLMATNPFYAHLVMKMPLQWMENVPGGISCTDGTSMFINPAEYLKMSKPEQASTLVHEVLHCAAGHLFRRGNRDPQRWNIAGDIYIANVIGEDNLAPITASEQFLKSIGVDRSKFRDLTTDQIYDKLPRKLGGGGKGKGKGDDQSKGNGQDNHWQPGGCYHEKSDSAERSACDAKWKQAVIEASHVAGNAAGAWRELVKAAMPRLPFHVKLYEYLNRGIGGDTTWDSFNRRWLWQGTYLPTDTKLTMGRVAMMVDTSGSMSTPQLQLVFGYVRSFRDQHPCVMDVIQCDYDVVDAAQHVTYEEWDQLPSTFTAIGRGGTSFDAPFKRLREKKIEPKVAIYLTDGYGQCTEKAPPYPVLWVVVRGDRSFKPPFGEVVYVNA